MSQDIHEEKKIKGFKPFLLIFGGLIVVLVILKYLIDVLL